MCRRYLVAGLAIEAIYLAGVLGPLSLLAHGLELTDLGQLTSYGPIAAVAVTTALVALFALYGYAILGASGQHNRCLPIVLAWTALHSLTLVFLYPATAIDVYNYAVEGHAAAFYNIDPLVTAPNMAGDDPFMAYAGTWAQSPSPYGPIWIILAKLIALIAGPNVVVAVVLLKGLAALAVVGTTFLLATAVSDRGPRARIIAAVLFGWNPLVQIELVGNGHNDAMLTLLLVGGVALVMRNRPALGALGIGAAVLIKLLPIGVVPLFLVATALDRRKSPRQRLLQMVTCAAILVGLATVAYAPFWVGPATLRRVLDVDINYAGSIPAFILVLIPTSYHWLVYPRLAVAATVGLWQARSLWLGIASLPMAAYEVLFATIVLATHFAGWYLPILVALAILSEDRLRQERIVIFTLTATLTTPAWAYVLTWTHDWVSNGQFHLILVPLTFIPPLILTTSFGRKLLGELAQRLKSSWLSPSRAALQESPAAVP